jgi:predicted amidohydrolase
MSKLRVKFFKDEGRDYAEVTIVGDPNSLIQKVNETHVKRFPREWEAYQRDAGEVEVKGTPLTEVPGIDRNVALSLKLKGVRVAEELAALDDGAAQGLGMGMMTFIKSARLLMKAKAAEAQLEVIAAAEVIKRGPGRPPKVDNVAAS